MLISNSGYNIGIILSNLIESYKQIDKIYKSFAKMKIIN